MRRGQCKLAVNQESSCKLVVLLLIFEDECSNAVERIFVKILCRNTYPWINSVFEDDYLIDWLMFAKVNVYMTSVDWCLQLFWDVRSG